MKSTLLRTFFEWALITSVLMSVGFFVWYYMKSHDVRNYNAQITSGQAHLQYNRNVMAILTAECQAYARTNADLGRFLTPASAPAAPATTKPGAK
jgi:hypothetical protein